MAPHVPQRARMGGCVSGWPASVAGVAHVEVLRGPQAAPGAVPSLLVEVPHGADRAIDFALLEKQLQGPLPSGLADFFFVNTDVGAWALGRAIASQTLALRPQTVALLVRCLVPRTFVDCNRNLAAEAGGDLREGAVTTGIPSYVTNPADQALLRQLHARYIALTDDAYEVVMSEGGLAVVPHTYAPRSVGIARVDEDIVEELHRVYSPELRDSWPLRAEIDLITRTPDGTRRSPHGAVEALIPGFADAGFQACEGDCYALHPATRAATLSARYPNRLLCFEARRDRVVRAWTPFAEMEADPGMVERIAGPIASWLSTALQT